MPSQLAPGVAEVAISKVACGPIVRVFQETHRACRLLLEMPCLQSHRPLSRDYHVDFVCFGEVVLEIKARSVTGPADNAQIINYLASMKKRHGLLLNFGTAKLEHKRFIWEPRTEV